MVHNYNPATEDNYNEDLKYWSNACGDLHEHGVRDITEDELPDELKRIFFDRWEENKDGNYCYLAEYRGIYGIALINEYHDIYEGKPYEYDYKLAEKVAALMDDIYGNQSKQANPDTQISILLGKELGFPDEDNAIEVVVFVPAKVDKSYFDEISAKFAAIAYKIA